MLTLDHLAVSASSLEEGRAMVETALGVALQPGGQHAHFATHNLLLGLEDGLYLEVIAPDPAVPAPPYPRWFDLDRFTGPPRLSNWICQTPDLPAAIAQFPQAGQAVALSRGDLRWAMAVPDTGRLPYDNLFPALMQWHGAAHPAPRLTASRCRLKMLTLRHPDAERLKATLSAYLKDARIRFETGDACLHAEISAPAGIRELS